jgi:hypothetical protein
MYHKKEALVVILVLVILLLAESGLGLEKYEQIVKGVADSTGEGDSDIGSDNDGKQYLGLGNLHHSKSSECEGDPWKTGLGDDGCVVDAWEDDYYDDCAYAEIFPGTIINNHDQGNLDNFQTYFSGCCQDAAGPLKYGNWVTSSADFAFLCGQDYYWYVCNEESEGQITWVYHSLFNCSKIGGYPDPEEYNWVKIDKDWDYDGYTEGQGDCDNSKKIDPACPLPDLSTLIGLPLDELRTTVRSTYCSDLRYSTCSICINPGAPEVCGDGINNDCGGPGQFEELTQLEGATFDDCNKNQYACRQEASPLANTEDNATGITQTNIYGETFSWINTQDGGYCCGFNGIDDLGRTEISSGGEGQFLCLNKNKDLVGHDTEYTYASPFCGDEWCWVSASTGVPVGGQFKIFTIKKPGSKPYDIASNGEGWFDCNEDNDNYNLSDPNPIGGLTYDDLLKKSHRYRCYDEGDHYSWAECADVWDNRNNKGIKGRYGGEGLFTLPLKPEDPTAVTLEESRTGQNIDVRSEFYSDYYGKDYLFDFSGYDYINFMVRFVDSAGVPVTQYDKNMFLPAGVMLEIKGPKPAGAGAALVYFNGNVLGYVVNSNLFNSENFMQVRVPLSTDYKGVSSILIKSSPDTNFIEVKNIYLSTDDFEKNQLCSGEQSTKDSSWLNNIDQGDTDKLITGEKLCRALYGKNAWLGKDDVIEDETASCCGNAPHEYYSGDSYLDENGIKYACWNSQPVASGSTIMDVEFEVKYTELEPSISYPEEEFGVKLDSDGLTFQLINGNYSCHIEETEETIKECEAIPSTCKVQWKDYGNAGYYNSNPTCSNSQPCSASSAGTLPYECDIQLGKCYTIQTAEKECLWSQNQLYQKVTKLDEIELEFGKVWFVEDTGLHYKLDNYNASSAINDIKVGIDTSPFKFGNITLNKRDFISPFNAQPYGGINITIVDSNPKVRVYLLNPRNNEEISDSTDTGAKITYNNLPTNDISILYLMAELIDKSASVTVESGDTDQTSNLSFSCSQEECLYPLPGEPPYTIKNLHPELYELYFVAGSKADEQTFIGAEEKTFKTYGNVKVKKLAQPILFVSGDDTTEPNFYGCQAASYLEGTNKLKAENNLPYCSVKAGQFCAYSTTYTSGKEPYTTINSWSADSITNVGYEDITVTDEQNLSAFYQTLELNLKNKTFLPETRNHSSIVLPARNFLSNAEFDVPSAKEVSHWEILDKNNQPLKDEKAKVNENKVTIAKDETLRSERIGVEQNLTLSFSQKSACQPKIYLVDKNGNKEEVNNSNSFSTGGASYLIVEYLGPCVIEQPMLQLVDKAGPTTYNYNPKYIQRAAAACCPETMCWNGYACVEEMSTMSYLSEHVAEGRDYRCIDGQWTASPSKWDWNKELWGFCPEDDQCLVLASQKGGKKDKIYADFYNGEFPQCINNTQYIMDNYCNNGSWTSRTKFVATKLLEVAETDDYILYCDNYKNALVELDEKEEYLGGIGISTQTEAPSLDMSLGGITPPSPQALCFENVKSSAEGQRLVPDKENICVNNVCVLKYKSSGEWKAAFATTLNKPVDDPNSFLFSLDVPQSKISAACTATGTSFAECPIEDMEGNMWYSPELNSVIYAKESIPLTPGTFDKIINWFSGLFGEESELSDEHKFVDQAQNFRELYILKLGDKKVTAMQEIQNEGKQMLVAEYEGFTTPICDYLNHLKLPPEMGVELLEELSGMGTYNCSSDGTKQRVEAIEGLDFLWPQLTGKLRVG